MSLAGRVETDADRPTVWVLDEDGVTRHPGREHRRLPRRVLVRWTVEATGMRYEQWVPPGRVTAREGEDD